MSLVSQLEYSHPSTTFQITKYPCKISNFDKEYRKYLPQFDLSQRIINAFFAFHHSLGQFGQFLVKPQSQRHDFPQ